MQPPFVQHCKLVFKRLRWAQIATCLSLLGSLFFFFMDPHKGTHIVLTGTGRTRYIVPMPRGPRNAPGGLIYHVLNRGVAREPLFHKDADYAAFERIIAETLKRFPMRILAYCLMPNHWHFLLWPQKDGELSAFMRWLTNTHTQRWHAHYHTSGTGHVYQNRFKSFPVQDDPHLLIAWRYVERNALRAGLVQRGEEWRWCSL
jgi:putative transposase